MATNPHDPRPQAKFYRNAATNRTEPRGAYVDQSITTRNLRDNVSTAVNPLDEKNLGETKVYEPEGTDHKPDNQPGDTPHSPNSWTIGHDYYKNNGMPGQDFFKNQG